MKSKYSILLFILLQMACFKDEETITKTIVKEKPAIVLANNKVVVHVTNEEGLALNGITANFNNTIKIINHDSYFYFNGVNVNKENELLQLTNANGETFEYNIYSIENDVNYIDVALYEGYKKSTLPAQTATLYEISDNISIDLKSDNYKVGINKYAGNINIKSNEYDLKNKNHIKALPSDDLININGKWSKMELHSAFRFDVLDNENRIVKLINPINCQFKSNIDNGTHLLYYDNKYHEWIIQSTINSATNSISIVNPGIYAIATIQEAVIAKGQFTINGDFPKNMEVIIKYNDQLITSKTSNSGTWEAVIPKNTPCIVSLVNEHTPLFEKTFKALTNRYDLGLLEVTDSSYNSIHLTGQLIDCDNQPMTPCYLSILNGGKSVNIFITNNNIDQYIPIKAIENTTIITPIDSLNKKYRPLIYEGKDIDLQRIYVCDAMANQYFTIRQGQSAFQIYTDITTIANDNEMVIRSNSNDDLIFRFHHANNVEKMINPKANIKLKAEGFASKGILIDCLTSSNCGFDNIQLTMIDTQNGWYKGSFKGKFWLKTIQPISAQNMDLEGEFFIKRN